MNKESEQKYVESKIREADTYRSRYAHMAIKADSLQKEIDRLKEYIAANHEHCPKCEEPYIPNLPNHRLMELEDLCKKFRRALEEISTMTVSVDAEDVKYVQASQWHKMKDIATEAIKE